MAALLHQMEKCKCPVNPFILCVVGDLDESFFHTSEACLNDTSTQRFSECEDKDTLL